jgi:hypothetical protein
VQKEQIVGIAVRLFAVFLTIYVLRHASGLIPYLADSSSYPISALFLFLIVLFPLLAAMLLWLFPLTVAAKLIPDINAKEASKTSGSGEWEVVAFSVLGLWVLTSAIPDAFHWATFVYVLNSSEMGRMALSPDNIGNIVATVVELVVGFWLLFGSKGLIGLVRYLRYAGS